MNTILDKLNFIIRNKVIAIIRANSSSDLLKVIDILHNNDLYVIEVSMTVPGSLEVIREANENYKSSNDILLGAGTVLDPETARACILSGAKFIVSPCINIDVIKLAHRYGVVAIPGAFTPNEIFNAWGAGADIVKVFPCSSVGPGYIRAIKAPLPDILLAPTGGVNLNNAIDFLKNGSDVLGMGNSLVSSKEIENKDFNSITEKARKISKICKTFKKEE